jgi:hypothetical protein
VAVWADLVALARFEPEFQLVQLVWQDFQTAKLLLLLLLTLKLSMLAELLFLWGDLLRAEMLLGLQLLLF